MIKSYTTGLFSNYQSLVKNMTKQMNNIEDNGCSVVSTDIRTKATPGALNYVGTIFYRVPKSVNFSLR